MTIYADGRIPYFYIIQHKESGIKYAGAKWGSDANPDTFMLDTREGYTTSSGTINDVLKDNEGVMYSVLEIILEEDLQIPFGCLKIKDYEDWFHVDNNCQKSDDWSNRSTPYNATYGTPEFHINMLKKFGYQHAMQVPEFLDTAILTKIDKYGYYSPYQDKTFMLNSVQSQYGEQYTAFAQVPEIQQKSKDTCNEKYGYDYIFQVPEIKQKGKDTSLLKFGVDHYAKLDECTDRVKTTKLEKYGDENYCNSQQISDTCMENHGSLWPQLCPEIKNKSISTLQSNYGKGYTNPFQIPEITAKIRIKADSTILEKYGVDNVSKVPYFCIECNKGGLGLGNAGRYHKTHTGIYITIRGEKVFYK